MAENKFRKAPFEIVNEGLEEMHYAFSDIVQSFIKLRGLAKFNQDEKALPWLQDLENDAYGVKEKVEKMNLLFQPYLKPHLDAITNCLDAELRRIQILKLCLVENQKYEYVAQLRDLQNDIERMKCRIKDMT
ncbi:hypothetical protein SAMN05421813_13716 [Daejeonella rubra]|uniref:Uncharacterized protein n=1 Tax=Daejeonella rubra TaxID=990371 RepID=A0A1G9YDC0_9SPHI|nr:hypothetical protein [Daejeonella rubra]SDN06403.1 hypothetical protein SAMN05421813_13716 [Daejeonella rubra]